MIYSERPSEPKIKIYKRTKKVVDFKEKDLKKTDLAFLRTLEVGEFELLQRLHKIDEKFSSADLETLRAIAFYENRANYDINGKIKKKAKAPPYRIYQDDALKAALKQLFNGKCAYCDSIFLETSNADIEHFRPKKAINRFENNKDSTPVYPGYYWLGAVWTNLFWSCANCNRTNRFFVTNEENKKLVGKLNRFPVVGRPENQTLSYLINIEEENQKCLFVNPTFDNPDDYFLYLENGEIEPIKKENKFSKKSWASIIGFGLYRQELVKRRGEVLANLRHVLVDLDKMIINYLDKTDAGFTALEERDNLMRKKEFIRQQFSKERAYLAAKRVLLKNFEFSNWEEKMGVSRMDLLKTNE